MSDPFTPPKDAGSVSARSRAHSSALLGYIAMLLCMFACCGGFPMLIAAIPVAGIGIHFGRAAIAEASDDEYTFHLARIGLASSVTALLFALLMVTLIAAYIGMYVLVVIAAIAGAL